MMRKLLPYCGGGTLGKTHGAADPMYIGAEPAGASIEEQSLGWKIHMELETVQILTSGLEGAWTTK
jgi:catalase-peroxidase